MRANGDIPCWISSLSAPLWRSPATIRIATKGSRKTAAISAALNAGAHTPISGDSASPTPAEVPFNPLTSEYVRTALMKDTPTSGPMPMSSTHHARDTRSSRHSLSSRQRNADLGERKHHFLQIPIWPGCIVSFGQSGKLADRAFSAAPPAAEQHEAVAEAR